MDKQQRNGTFHSASLVHIVHVQLTKSLYLDGTREHGQPVKLALVRTPVIPIPPSLSKPSYVRQRSAVRPVCFIYFVWEPGVLKLALKERKGLLWDSNLKGLLAGHGE
jgi:hypothetical protein